jgi:hypothetical protein
MTKWVEVIKIIWPNGYNVIGLGEVAEPELK